MEYYNSVDTELFEKKKKTKKAKIIASLLAIGFVTTISVGTYFLVKNIKQKNHTKRYEEEVKKLNSLLSESNIFLNTEFNTEEIRKKMNYDLITTINSIENYLLQLDVSKNKLLPETLEEISNLRYKLKKIFLKSKENKAIHDKKREIINNLYSNLKNFSENKLYKYNYWKFRDDVENKLQRFKKYIDYGNYFSLNDLNLQIENLKRETSYLLQNFNEREQVINELSNLIQIARNFVDNELNKNVFSLLKIQLTKEINNSVDYLFKTKIVSDVDTSITFDVNVETIKNQITKLNALYLATLEKYNFRNKVFIELKRTISSADQFKIQLSKILKYKEIYDKLQKEILKATYVLNDSDSNEIEFQRSKVNLSYLLSNISIEKERIDYSYNNFHNELRKLVMWKEDIRLKDSYFKELLEEVNEEIKNNELILEKQELKEEEIDLKTKNIPNKISEFKQKLSVFKDFAKEYDKKMMDVQNKINYTNIKLEQYWPVKTLKTTKEEIDKEYHKGSFNNQNFNEWLQKIDHALKDYDENLQHQKDVIEKIFKIWEKVQENTNSIPELYHKAITQKKDKVDTNDTKTYESLTKDYKGLKNEDILSPQYDYTKLQQIWEKMQQFKSRLEDILKE